MKANIVILCCLLVSALSEAQNFRITKNDLAGWSLCALAGVSWGAHEAYQADPYVFERRGLTGDFWAHDAWKNKYHNRNPEEGLKGEFPFGNTFRDVDHASGAAHAVFFGAGTLIVAINNETPPKHKIVKSIVGMVVRSAFASVTYRLLRQ